MQLSHTRPVTAARFDDPNLVSYAGLVPIMALAEQSGLLELADEHLSVPTDKGANAGRKIGSTVAGMIAGADSISDLNRVRHGAMGTLFHRPLAPSTLGSFLRELTFGHIRQLDAVASRLLGRLSAGTPVVAGIDTERVLVDIDDSIIEVHGHHKQGSSYGYSGVRGLNALITTVTTDTGAPVIVGQRLRKRVLRILAGSRPDDRRRPDHRRSSAHRIHRVIGGVRNRNRQRRCAAHCAQTPATSRFRVFRISHDRRRDQRVEPTCRSRPG